MLHNIVNNKFVNEHTVAQIKRGRQHTVHNELFDNVCISTLKLDERIDGLNRIYISLSASPPTILPLIPLASPPPKKIPLS